MDKFLYIWNSNRKIQYIIFFIIFSVSMLFALYTEHVWEDYYITYRCSKNLAVGHGLVYRPSEKIHTFTSPFNVLIPAFLNILSRNQSDVLVLWLFRIICSVLLGISGVLLFEIAKNGSLKFLSVVLLVSMFGLNAKIIDFSINGQEIAFMVFFLALIFYSLLISTRYTFLKLGIAWAGLMWTRPDSFIYIGAISLSFIIFAEKSPVAESRITLIKLLIKAGIITTILYVPWIIFAWCYYGSPIPHTVIAKGLNMTDYSIFHKLIKVLGFPFVALFRKSTLDGTFLPPYGAYFGGWHPVLTYYSRILSWICLIYWIFPFSRYRTRIFSFAFMTGQIYLSCIIPNPHTWYIPNCTFLGIITLAFITNDIQDHIRLMNNKIREDIIKVLNIFLIIIIWGIILINLFLTLASAYQLSIQQKIIETNHRKQIGLWLKENAFSPRDTVFLEPLGYIGFFSELKMYDFPGLSSPEVVSARKKLKTDKWAELILELKPDWLVLRPWEIQQIHKENPNVLGKLYFLVKVFDKSEKIESYKFLPGRSYLNYDKSFLIFLSTNKRKQFLQKNRNSPP